MSDIFDVLLGAFADTISGDNRDRPGPEAFTHISRRQGGAIDVIDDCVLVTTYIDSRHALCCRNSRLMTS